MAKTKIVANYLRKAINEDGNLEVTFEVSNYHYKRYCQELQKKSVQLGNCRSKKQTQYKSKQLLVGADPRDYKTSKRIK